MEQANESSSGTITFKKDMLWKATTFIFAALLVVSLFTGGFGLKKSDTTVTGNVVNNPTNPSIDNPTPSAVKVSEDDDPVLGKKDAPVTIIEFSDYQCPFCRKFWQDTLPSIKKDYIDTGKVKLVYRYFATHIKSLTGFNQIKANYIDTGKVNLVFRDFPLTSLHPMAVVSGEAAECARDVGGSDEAYFKMHDKIFAEQNKLDGGSVSSTVQFTNEDIKKWAKEIGYDIGSCIDSVKYKDEIQKDIADGGSGGVSGTPAFFVNGQLVSGAQPYSAFKQIIDAELLK